MCVLHSNDERCFSLVNETSSINFVFQDIDLWMNIDAIGILFTWKMFRILLLKYYHLSIQIYSSFFLHSISFELSSQHLCFGCVCVSIECVCLSVQSLFSEHLQFKSHTTITRIMCVSCRYEHGWKHHLENHWMKERCPGENNQIKQTTFGDM